MKRRFIILLLIIIALSCLIAKNPDPKAVVGKIDNITYTYSEYDKILSNYYAYYQKKWGHPLSEEEKAKLNNQCWEELVGRYIYDKAIKAGKITITQAELLREAKKNPPEAVKQIPELKTNGKFDKKKYENALNNVPDFKKAVLEEVKALYQYQKLLNTIRNEVTVSEDSVYAEWLRENDLVDAQIICFDAKKLTSVIASEEECQQYYEANKEQYRKDNCRRYRYVKIPRAPSTADSLSVKEEVMKMYQDLLAGADFAEMAKAKSQDPGSAEKGGDLGWFGRGQMIPVFEETAFKTPPGLIAEPILSNYGWHIIQTLDRRQTVNGEEVLARHILARIEPSETTLQQMKITAITLYQKAQEKGLQKAAQEMGLVVEESGAFQEKDSFIKGIGRDANLVSFAFQNPIGSLANIYYSPNGDAYICEIADSIAVYYTPFEDEKIRIMNTVNRDKRHSFMNDYAHNFMQNYTPDQYLAQAERDSLIVIEITNHKKGDPISSLGKIPALDDALFKTPVESFTPLINDQSRWFLAKITKHQVPDPTEWEKNKAALMKAAKEKAGQDHLNQWYLEERRKVNIIDNRRDFYDLSSTDKIIQL
ncbi:MAG: peptidylprolyl isomerase [Candidatus Cloacimonetes bacterium]|nr:peptidylprolyl isomerase [Candidatus Cloacimonadota bacterium]